MRYIIGDVHGCYNTLLALIAKLPKGAKITFVGDIIDRGKNSCDVIELIKNNNYDCVLGNHELFMIEALESFFSQEISFEHDIWYTHNGGKATIGSYYNKEYLIKEHLDWLKKLPLYIQYDDIKVQDRTLVVTHSSIGNNWAERTNKLLDSNKKYFIRSVLSSRKDSIFDNKDIYNVFGHTPLVKEDINIHYANIDTGCVYKNKIKAKGILTALEVPSLKVIKQKNIEA